MPWTVGEDGGLTWVEQTPDRVTPHPPAQPGESTIRPELENQTDRNERKVPLVNESGTVFEVGESGVRTALDRDRGLRLATTEDVRQWDHRNDPKPMPWPTIAAVAVGATLLLLALRSRRDSAAIERDE